MLGQPLYKHFRYGFEYSDCWVDDARLVVLTAMDARERGAEIRTRTKLVRADRGEQWDLVLTNHGRRETARARVLVNAAGPWIGEVADTVLREPLRKPVRLVKGSHIVVRRRFAHDNGYILQSEDKRIVFALPFAEDFTLIGTTDEAFLGDLTAPAPSAQEVLYLCDVMNGYFRDKIMPDELVWSYSGVRALLDDGSRKAEDVTRDYTLVLDKARRKAPLLTVYGGKITTYRRLAESALHKLKRVLKPGPAWTAKSRLPGGDFPPTDFYEVVAAAIARWPFLSEPYARRLVRAYGTRLEQILGNAESMQDLGPRFAGDLTGAEVRYLVQHEWVETADDVLWRRSKLGLKAKAEDRVAINRFIAEERAQPSAASPQG
jgi:glycerol-3-phosphate dehydrogenase